MNAGVSGEVLNGKEILTVFLSTEVHTITAAIRQCLLRNCVCMCVFVCMCLCVRIYVCVFVYSCMCEDHLVCTSTSTLPPAAFVRFSR